ncbi:MAG TPA: DUF4129 domain-containing protein [Steroidobacteraceae bacterium]|nr:DUF4129 domain-containing protein [Steroidobacteraceae bacterium]
MRAWIGLLVLVLPGVALAADDPALRVVEACRARLDARVDIGIERIQKRCPDLLPALASAPWRDLLPPTLRERREEITAGSLRALEDLIRQSGEGATPRPAPDRERLDAVLAELGEKGQQGATRWERFKQWLKDKVENRKEDDETSWLERLARQFKTSEGVAQFITYTGYVMVGVLVAFVIVSELRAAGLFGGTRRASRRANPSAEWRRRLVLADVARAPLADRPGMLLRLLGEALTRAQRLPAADGLTATAIAQRARLDSADERDELRRLAATADVVRYGDTPPADESIEGAVAAARTLLEKFARQVKH